MENLSVPADNPNNKQNVGGTDFSNTTETYTPENVELLRTLDNKSSSGTSLTQNDSDNNKEQASITNSKSKDSLPNLELVDGAGTETEGPTDAEGKAPKADGAQIAPNTATSDDANDAVQSDPGKQNVRDANLAASLDEPSQDTKPNSEKKSNQGKDKPNEKDIQRHVDDLGADKFKTRTEAQKSLEAMGPEALPALEKAHKESKDPEVQRRAESAINSIRARVESANNKEFLDKANQSEPAVDNLLDKAGVSVSYNKNPPIIAGANGAAQELARFQQLYGEPKGQLSESDKKSAEDLVKMGDSLKNNEKFAKAKGSLENQSGPEAEKDAVKINKMALMAENGKQLYARALSNSDNPKDQQRGIELLTEAINANKGQEPGWSVTETAARLGADKDPKFKDVFQKAGGDVNELEEKADRIREYKKEKKR